MILDYLPPVRLVRALIARRVEAPESYNLLQRVVGSERVWRVFVGEHLRPRPGLRVLDIGCGPAEVLSYLPEVEYLGIEPHQPYVDGARRRYGARGRFRQASAQELVAEGAAPFDVVMLLGVLHHLDDATAASMLAAARALTAPGGRLLTLDGCYAPGQSVIARAAFWADRGDFTRDEAGYLRLIRGSYAEVKTSLRGALLRLPYTYLIVEAR